MVLRICISDYDISFNDFEGQDQKSSDSLVSRLPQKENESLLSSYATDSC